MAGYVYLVKQTNHQLDEEQIRLLTTRKYEATKFLESQIKAGEPLALFEVSRSRDGRVDSTVIVDPYEFMKIDLGEE
jgi:hypothetical protein